MNNSYEQAFNQIEFYQKHSYMKPFVGDRYESPSHKKLVIIGESHYLPAHSMVHLNIDKWYDGTCELTDKEQDWCNTKNSRIYGYGKQFQQVIEKDLKEQFNADFNDVASFNYFLRPSSMGKSIKKICTRIDRTYAAKNLKQVLEIMKPDIVVFASDYAYDCAAWKDDFPVANDKDTFEKFAQRLNFIPVKANHPARGWWKRLVRGEEEISQEIFIKALKENWILH